MVPRLLVLELEPVDAVGAAVLVVVAAVGAAAVHQHAVQAVLVALAAVRVRGQVFAVADVQVQLLVELIPVVDLRSGTRGLQARRGPVVTEPAGCGSRGPTMQSHS